MLYIILFFQHIKQVKKSIADQLMAAKKKYVKSDLKDTGIIRHSRLPAGNALWVCQNFFFFFFSFFFFFFFLFFFFFFFFYSSAAKVSG